MNQHERAVLALEDGTWYTGRAVGARGKAAGEVVFRTSMTGYQEALTDPASSGHVLVMTYPLVGNYGVNPDDAESPAVHAKGLVIREACRKPSNGRATASLEEYLAEHGVIAITGVDTRALTRRIRDHGPLRGVIATGEIDVEPLIAEARRAPQMADEDFVLRVSTKKTYLFADGSGPRVTVIDCGARKSLLLALARRGCRVAVVPAKAPVDEIMATEPDGIVISSGPGDPAVPHYLASTVQRLVRLDNGPAVLGIGLGHQMIARAFGARTERLAHGHHGANLPVKDLESGRVYITAQNHGFVVVDGSWTDPDWLVTHRNVNDGTIEGLAHRQRPIASYQFQPESPSGLADAAYLIDRFVDRL